ncbi:hypothetical protein GW17_00023702 [Ensete ventricosum]|nr:hypothetical protein GW17_00023702 [Ensete ventricosum]
MNDTFLASIILINVLIHQVEIILPRGGTKGTLKLSFNRVYMIRALEADFKKVVGIRMAHILLDGIYSSDCLCTVMKADDMQTINCIASFQPQPINASLACCVAFRLLFFLLSASSSSSLRSVEEQLVVSTAPPIELLQIQGRRSMAERRDGGERGGIEEVVDAKLEFTPTWIVAAVCTIIIFISLAAERYLHYLGKVPPLSHLPERSAGEVPLLSVEAIHQLHIFIFVLAVTHFLFSAFIHSFFKQFFLSVTKSDYVTLRLIFIMLASLGLCDHFLVAEYQ